MRIAVCQRSAPVQEVAGVGCVRENWRFKGADPSSRPREVLQSFGDAFEDPRTVKRDEEHSADPFELDSNFSEVPQSFMDESEWHLTFSRRMLHPEHITLLEGRGVLAAFRRKSRCLEGFGKRHLTLALFWQLIRGAAPP